MSFGAAAYGSATYGGIANSANEQAFFSFIPRPPDTLFGASAIFSGSNDWYEIRTLQSSEPGAGPSGVIYEIYTSHDPNETPQRQTTLEGNGQAIIAAAPFIKVTAFIDGEVWDLGMIFKVVGRPYTQ